MSRNGALRFAASRSLPSPIRQCHEGVNPTLPPLPLPSPSLTICQGHQQAAAHARVGNLETLYRGEAAHGVGT